MNIDKTYTIELRGKTLVDVCFSVAIPESSYEDYDSEYSYDESGLQGDQIEELEDIINASVDKWLEDVIAEHEESLEDEESTEWEDEY